MYGDIAKLVVSADDMTQILQCTTDWKDIGDIVDRVCSSKLGFGMFAWAQQHVTSAKLSDLMCQHIDRLKGLATIGEKDVCVAKQSMTDGAENLVGISGLPSRLDGHSSRFLDISPGVLGLLSLGWISGFGTHLEGRSPDYCQDLLGTRVSGTSMGSSEVPSDRSCDGLGLGPKQQQRPWGTHTHTRHIDEFRGGSKMGELRPGPRRTVQIPYRSAMLELRVASISEEAELRIAALLKGLGVEQGLLQGFWVEDELLADDTIVTNDARMKSVAPALLAPYAQPRSTASALFSDHPTELDASEVSRLLAAKEDWMISMDRTFLIEFSFLTGMLGAGGEQVVWAPTHVPEVGLKGSGGVRLDFRCAA